MNTWIADGDWEIITDTDGRKTVITCGDEILCVGPHWTDDQINTLMYQANWAYSMGFEAGKRKKVNEFKKALEI